MQKSSFIYLLLLVFASNWFLSRWTFLQELRDDIAFAKNLDTPEYEQIEALWPARHLADTLNADTSLAFTSIFSDTLHHGLNMHDILSASGHVRTSAYGDLLMPEIIRHIIRNSGLLWFGDMATLAKNVIDSTKLFPVQCWDPWKVYMDGSWPTSFSALRDMHHLYSLSQNATDFDTRFRIARDFRKTQARIQTLSGLTIDDTRACYGPFLGYLDDRILPTSRRVVSEVRRMLAELDDAIHDLEHDIVALPWFTRYLNRIAPHALQESLQALSDVRPAFQGFLRDIETVHGNLQLMARYSDWMLSHEWSYAPASLSNPPDLTRFMNLIHDMEANSLLLNEKTLQNTRTFKISPPGSPRKQPSIPPPTVLWDLVTLGLWCP
ncbi:hypothetical protein BDZ89DRAFT_1146438 [Hymenopellis radicata]|nr:hypothetical protein BDZ89DRAFT_1146438 [Hymenopellis radicata]